MNNLCFTNQTFFSRQCTLQFFIRATQAAPSCRRAGRQHTGHGGPDTGEGWEITETTDPGLLTEYGLHAELARFFATPDEHGEYIGTSGPIDFCCFTLAVEHQTDFTRARCLRPWAG